MEKISGIFLDYAGTISPLNVTRQQSSVSLHLQAVLSNMRRFVPIGIVTAKDLPFILPRTYFAHAWSAIAGLELKVGSQVFSDQEAEESRPYLNSALSFAKTHLVDGAVIEEKLDSTGQPRAFCVDWRQAKNHKRAKAKLARTLSYCKSFPLKVIEYERYPYFDVFPQAMDKGRAVRKLREQIVLSGSVLYMGDSRTDNAGFKEAEVSIGVTDGKKPKDLDCQFWVNVNDVCIFLNSLLKEQFNFSADLPGIHVNQKDAVIL